MCFNTNEEPLSELVCIRVGKCFFCTYLCGEFSEVIGAEILETKALANLKMSSVFMADCAIKISEEHNAAKIYPPDLGYLIHGGIIESEQKTKSFFPANEFIKSAAWTYSILI